MDYRKYPIFCNITNAAVKYLDGFDEYLIKQKISLEPLELLIRKIYLYYNWLNEHNKKQNTEKFNTSIYKEYVDCSKYGVVYFPAMIDMIYKVRRTSINIPPLNSNKYNELMQQWKILNPQFTIKVGSIENGGNGWVFKTSPQYNAIKRQNPNKLHRFILNVNPNIELLKQLDKFALEYNCQYKCAETIDVAYSRPDCIVVYTADNRWINQINELKNIIVPYVRKNGNELLDGDKICDGLYTALEPKRSEIESIIKQSNCVYPRLGTQLEIKINQTSRQHPLSLGEFKIYKDIYDSLKIHQYVETFFIKRYKNTTKKQ